MSIVRNFCIVWLLFSVNGKGEDSSWVEIELQKLRQEMPSLWRYQNQGGEVSELRVSDSAIEWLKGLMEGDVTGSKVVVSCEIPDNEARVFASSSRTDFEDGEACGKIFLGPPRPRLYFKEQVSNEVFYALWFQLVFEAMNLKRGGAFRKSHAAARSGKINVKTYVAEQINLEIGSGRETLSVMEELFFHLGVEMTKAIKGGRSAYPSRRMSYDEICQNPAYQSHVRYYAKAYEEMRLRAQLHLHLKQRVGAGG